jgi:hypothetical protein
MSVQMAKAKQAALQTGKMPNDVGLLPDTFVMPRGARLPSWSGAFRDRWRLEKKRAWVRITDAIS